MRLVKGLYKTIRKPQNGFTKPLKADLLKRNIALASYFAKVSVFRGIMPTQNNGFRKLPNKVRSKRI